MSLSSRLATPRLVLLMDLLLGVRSSRRRKEKKKKKKFPVADGSVFFHLRSEQSLFFDYLDCCISSPVVNFDFSEIIVHPFHPGSVRIEFPLIERIYTPLTLPPSQSTLETLTIPYFSREYHQPN